MDTEQIRKKIQTYLVKGEIDDALNFLITEFNIKEYRQVYDNALMHKAKWENIKQGQLKGILSSQEYELALSKIIDGIQTITNEVDRIQTKTNEVGSPTQNHRNTRLKGLLILISVIGMIVLSVWYGSTFRSVKLAKKPSSASSEIKQTAVGSSNDKPIGVKSNGNFDPPSQQNKPISKPATDIAENHFPKSEITIETKNITILLNDDNQLKIDGVLLSGTGIFKTNLTLGEHKFEIIEAATAQKCIQTHIVNNTTTTLTLTCN